MATETVLIVGATGNIGVSVVIAALNTKRNVLAVVRNQASAEKLFEHVGTREGITTVEADVTSEHGVADVVDKVKKGELPAFQHVYSTVGLLVHTMPVQDVDIATYRQAMKVTVDGNFFAYRATISYLIEQGHPQSTWTLITGAAGEWGILGVTAISQGALFTLANVACFENKDTNVRFNEVFLSYRVDYDKVAKAKGKDCMSSSEFAAHYEGILANPEIDASRVTILAPDEVRDLKFEKKLRPLPFDLPTIRNKSSSS